MPRTPFETEQEQDKAVVLIVAEGWKDVITPIRQKLDKKQCRIILTGPQSVPSIPSDYIILFGVRIIPSVCSSIIKKTKAKLPGGKPRLLYVDTPKGLANVQTYQWLLTMKQSYDIRYCVAKPEEQYAEGILAELFHFRPSSRQDIMLEKRYRMAQQRKDTLVKYKNEGEIKKSVEKTSVKPLPPLKHIREQVGEKNGILHVERRLFIPGRGVFVHGMALGIIVFFIVSPFLIFSARLGLGFWGLKKVTASIAHAQVSSNDVSFAEQQFKGARAILGKAQAFFAPFSQTKPFEVFDSVVRIGESSSVLAKQSIAAIQIIKDISAVVLHGEPLSLSSAITRSEKVLFTTEQELENIDGTIEQIIQTGVLSLPFISRLQPSVLATQKLAQDISELVRVSRTLAPVIPSFLGEKGNKTYLLLFQNNMELRPGGGFIGSFALAAFDHGRLADFEVEDVYEADGQLKGHVDPPEPIRRYLEQPHWYMRDSNFYPDFPESAKKVEWFLNKETGISVDGTIAMDLTFAQYVIDALGGVYLPDYGETITADNLFLKAQTYAQQDFFPGSTRKRDFLGSLSRRIIFELKSSGTLPWLKLAQAAKRALDEKHLLLSFNDGTIESTFDTAGWTGRMHPAACVKATLTCIPDYIAVSEANLGVNKANAFLTRSFIHRIQFIGKKVIRKTTIHYVNKGVTKTFPTGDYKSYIRIYLPSQAKKISIHDLGNTDEDQNIDRFQYQDKIGLGLFMIVPVGQVRTLTVDYELPMSEDNQQSLYQFWVQKQPGTGSDPVELEINTENHRITETNFPVIKSQNGKTQKSSLLTNLFLGDSSKTDIEKAQEERYNASSGNNGVLGKNNDSLVYSTDLSVDRIFQFILF